MSAASPSKPLWHGLTMIKMSVVDQDVISLRRMIRQQRLCPGPLQPGIMEYGEASHAEAKGRRPCTATSDGQAGENGMQRHRPCLWHAPTKELNRATHTLAAYLANRRSVRAKEGQDRSEEEEEHPRRIVGGGAPSACARFPHIGSGEPPRRLCRCGAPPARGEVATLCTT